jgi:hypothetical protein
MSREPIGATRSCAELTGDLTIDDDSVVRHCDETQ